MALRVWVWVGVAVVAAACGGETNSDGPGEAKPAGQGHSPASAGVAGDGNVRGDAGEGGELGLPGVGGIGGSVDDVSMAAEQGLSLQDVELRHDALAGQSFTLSSSLCIPYGAGGEGNIGGGPSGGDPLPVFHVREAQGGGLEAVTYTADGGEPLVQVRPMRQSGLGWDVRDVATCASLNYVFEEEYETRRYTAKHVHIVFLRATASSELAAIVAASGEGEPRVSRALLDTEPPTVSAVRLLGHASVDRYPNSGFEQPLMFSEPLSPESEIVIEDQLGARAEIEPILSEGYLVGFTVPDLLSSGLTIGGDLRDLAGNALLGAPAYPGIELQPTSGDFEDEVEFIDPDRWISDGPSYCDHVGPAGNWTEPGYTTQVPALAGSKSFLAGADDDFGHSCPVWLRLQAQPADTQLLFEARLLGNFVADEPQMLRVCVSSLTAGGDDSCTELQTSWSIDESFATVQHSVSTTQTLAFQLPGGATDLFVEVDAPEHQLLWMDSLRVE